MEHYVVIVLKLRTYYYSSNRVRVGRPSDVLVFLEEIPTKIENDTVLKLG